MGILGGILSWGVRVLQSFTNCIRSATSEKVSRKDPDRHKSRGQRGDNCLGQECKRSLTESSGPHQGSIPTSVSQSIREEQAASSNAEAPANRGGEIRPDRHFRAITFKLDSRSVMDLSVKPCGKRRIDIAARSPSRPIVGIGFLRKERNYIRGSVRLLERTPTCLHWE